MSWIYFIVGILCLIVLQLLRSALSMEFPKYSARAIPRPDAHKFGGLNLIEAKTERLAALGFAGPEWVGSSMGDDEDMTLHAVYGNDEARVVAWLGPTSEIAFPNQLLTYYTTLLEDGRYAVTQVSDPYFESVSDPQTPAQTIAPSDEVTELGKHKDFVSGLGVAPSEQPQMAGVMQFAGEHLNAIRSRLLERGRIVESKDVARPSLFFAIGLLRALLSRPKSPQQDATPIPAPQLAFLSGVIGRAKHRAPSQQMQWFLLLLSGVLFVAIGWPLLGMTFTVVILGVIVFHEAGHWAAMRMFGYRNPHITLLPLLGGVTIGYETEPTAVKRAWVALAGPLPGILLAWLLFYLYGFGVTDLSISSTWMMSTIIALLFVNYLNVLPIPPLDGSHVLQAVLPPRWLVIQALVVLIGVVMGVYVAYLLEFWPLALIGVLQLFGLRSLWRTAGLVKRFDASLPRDDSSEAVRTAWLLAELEKDLGAAKNPAKRVALASTVLTQLDTEPMGGMQRTLVSTVYLALAVVPVAALVLVAASSPGPSVRPEVAALHEDTSDVYEALHSQAADMDYATLIEAIAWEQALPVPASEGTLEVAEHHLGQSLPRHLRDFYRLSNGMPKSLGLHSVEDVRAADPEMFLSGELRWYVHEGALYFYGQSLGDLSIAVEETHGWWHAGSNPEWASHIYVDPNAAPGEPGVFVLDENGSSAYETVRELVEATWIDQESAQIYADHTARVRASLEDSMRYLTVVDLLDEFPRPNIFARLIAGEVFERGPASPDALAAAERRLGRSLPEDHRQVLEQHNGFPPVQLLPVEDIQPGGSVDARYLEWALELANGLQSGQLLKPDIESCWVIGGQLVEEVAGSAKSNLYPALFWCPEKQQELRYLDLSSGRFQQSFTDVLRARAVLMNSY